MIDSGSGSLRHGLAILESFSVNEPELGISEISRRLALTKSTVHRLVVTLVECGYLAQDQSTKKYHLSLRMYEKGSVAVRHAGLHRVALSPLERLSRETGETVHLTVLGDGAVIHIQSIEGSQPLHASSRLGERAPAHCSAPGKVLLAYSPESTVTSFLAQGLPRITATTITDPAVFKAELMAIRTRGYSMDLEEYHEGIRCIASPVFDNSGNAVAAVALPAPTSRMSEARQKELAEMVVAVARHISEGLGFTAETEASGASGMDSRSWS